MRGALYERDDETGLDYAQARYYGSAMGRFISIDPLMASGHTQRQRRFYLAGVWILRRIVGRGVEVGKEQYATLYA